jgi:transaldolase
LKFFIDTADTDEIKALAGTGMVDGVTTNPSLIAKTGRQFLDVIEEICGIVEGPVSAEVTAIDAETMIKEGQKLAAIADNVAVKVPLTEDGLITCKTLSDAGTMVNVTLCFSAAQAILAAKAGATFVSPFVGRLDDLSQDGMQLISDICDIYANYTAFETEILVASVRGPQHVVDAARLGADIVTIPPSALKQLFKHPLTDKGLAAFLDDWAKTGQSILGD